MERDKACHPAFVPGEQVVYEVIRMVGTFDLIGAALPICGGAIGTGIAMAGIGSAAMGYLAEDKGAVGTVMIFVAMPETIVILGFVMSFLLLSTATAAVGAPVK